MTKQSSRYTEGDVRAEVAHSLARAADLPLRALAPTWKRLRELAADVGCPQVLAPYREELARLFRETIDLGPERKGAQCARCRLSWEPREGAVECPHCAWQASQYELEKLRCEAIPRGAGGMPDADGWMPLGFELQTTENTASQHIHVTAYPQCRFLPRLLCVSPSSEFPPGAMLRSFRCGWREYVQPPGVPLDVFSPRHWADPRLMAQAQWDCEAVPIAVQIALEIDLGTPRPVRFSAVLWGKAVP